MKWLILVSIMLGFLSNSWSVEGELNSFCKELDKTLRTLTKASPSGCKSQKAYLSAKTSTYKSKTTTELSPDDAQKLFREMQSHSELSFNFPYDGCVLRSEEMSRLMLLNGVKPLMGYSWVDDNKTPRLRYIDPKNPSKFVEWIHHQAPVVMVRTKGKLVPYVIDPSTQKGAVSFEQWKKSISSHDKKIKVQSEIGEVISDFTNEASNASRQQSLKRLKFFEGQADGIEQYQTEMMMKQEDDEGKIDAMSGGN